MNLAMIQSTNKTDDLLLSITKNCDALIQQTHTKPQETLEFKLSQPKQIFTFTPSNNLGFDSKVIIGLANVEVYTSLYNLTEQNNKFDLYTDTFDEFLFEELKDELEEILSISDITPKHLQRQIIGQCIIQACKKLRSEKSSTDGHLLLLRGYARSQFRDFGSYLRIFVGLDKKNIQLILKQNNSYFLSFELPPGFCSIRDISDVVYTMGDHKGTLQVEYDEMA